VLTAGVGADPMARTATEHLLGLGHVTVHHLAGPQRWYAARDRLEGWRATLTAHDREVPTIAQGDWSAASGYAAGRELAENRAVTAVFAANDDMAIGLIRALTEAGRRVPEDVSVIGFDDIAEAGSFLPPLTTVHQDFAEVGRLCVRAVLRKMRAAGPEQGTTLVPTRLVTRASTAPPPA
jgi:DNA-binding LacI/PurR family transcriptional regulator